MKFKFVKVIECGFLSRYLHLTNINEQISMDMGGGGGMLNHCTDKMAQMCGHRLSF